MLPEEVGYRSRWVRLGWLGRLCLLWVALGSVWVGSLATCRGMVLSAEVGFEGWYLEGVETAVRVTIRTDDADDYGPVLLTASAVGLGGLLHGPVHSQALDIRGRSDLLVELPLVMGASGEFRIELRREADGVVLWDEVFSGRRYPVSGRMLVGISDLTALDLAVEATLGRPLARVSVAELPRYSWGYAAVSVMIGWNFPWERLLADQLLGLEQYLAMGGVLLLMGDAQELYGRLEQSGWWSGAGIPALLQRWEWRRAALGGHAAWEAEVGLGRLVIMPAENSAEGEGFDWLRGPLLELSPRMDESGFWNLPEVLRKWEDERGIDPVRHLSGIRIPSRLAIGFLLVMNLVFGMGGAAYFLFKRGSSLKAWSWLLLFGLFFAGGLFVAGGGRGGRELGVSGLGLRMRWAGVRGSRQWMAMGLLSSIPRRLDWEQTGQWTMRSQGAATQGGEVQWAGDKTRMSFAMSAGALQRLNLSRMEREESAPTFPKWDRIQRRLVWDLPDRAANGWLLAGRGGRFPMAGMDAGGGWSLEQLAWMNPESSSVVTRGRWNRHDLVHQAPSYHRNPRLRAQWVQGEWLVQLQRLLISGGGDWVAVANPTGFPDDVLGRDRSDSESASFYDLWMAPLPDEVFCAEGELNAEFEVERGHWRVPLERILPAGRWDVLAGGVLCAIHWGVGMGAGRTEGPWGLEGRLISEEFGKVWACRTVDYPFRPLDERMPYMGGSIPPTHDMVPHRMSLHHLQWDWRGLAVEDQPESLVLELKVHAPAGHEHSWRIREFRMRTVGVYAEQ